MLAIIVRIIVLSLILVLGACSSFRFDDNRAFITSASFRSQSESPIVAVNLLKKPLQTLPTIAPLSIESPQAIIPNITERILFDSDSATLSPSAMTQLDNFAIAVADGDYQILVEGHTDSTNSYEYNQSLSRVRAIVVKEALINRGILPSRLVVAYYGETKAIATNKHPKGKQQNRRVELRPIKPFSSKTLPAASMDTGLKPPSSATTESFSPKTLPPVSRNTSLKPLFTPDNPEIIDVLQYE